MCVCEGGWRIISDEERRGVEIAMRGGGAGEVCIGAWNGLEWEDVTG